VQQHVVQRRRPVEAQRARDVGERPVGDADREPLVDPEADADLGGAQHDRERHQREQPDGHRGAAGQRRGQELPTVHFVVSVIRG
jgi:hypothetical protein